MVSLPASPSSSALVAEAVARVMVSLPVPPRKVAPAKRDSHAETVIAAVALQERRTSSNTLRNGVITGTTVKNVSAAFAVNEVPPSEAAIESAPEVPRAYSRCRSRE